MLFRSFPVTMIKEKRVVAHDRLSYVKVYKEGLVVMPWRLQAMKDVVACDKLRGVSKHTLIRRFPNGATHPFRVLHTEYIGMQGERGELKHLSSCRKRNQPRFPK